MQVHGVAVDVEDSDTLDVVVLRISDVVVAKDVVETTLVAVSLVDASLVDVSLLDAAIYIVNECETQRSTK